MASVAGNILHENASSIPDNVVSVKDHPTFSGINIKDNKQENQLGSLKEEQIEHGTCSEVVSGCVPSLQGKHENQR